MSTASYRHLDGTRSQTQFSDDSDSSFWIYQNGWTKRNVAAVGGNHGYLLVYENRSDQTGSRQHIYATKIWQTGIFLPLVFR